ncbi:MAG: HD domain-containing protein [Fimbriimonadales bacterium]|nr:HD domain-containing protein [Fimbriimonadales bacterium]
MALITLDDVRNNETVRTYIQMANQMLYAMGYTEHGLRHAGLVANNARRLCLKLGYSERQAELAAIAGFMHDIGNVINRDHHAQTGAMIAFQLLTQMGMPADEIAIIISAIGNHEETTGFPVNYAASTVILADKSDVHFSRVQNPNQGEFDIHDRVNFATQRSRLRVMPKERLIELNLEIDTSVASLMEYFEIFLERMVMCRRAAEALECQFHLMINSAPIG